MTEPLRMLDTDIVSYQIKRRHPEVEQRFARMPVRSTCISAITLSELLYGLAPLGASHPRTVAVDRFLQDMTVMSWDAGAATVHARIRRVGRHA